MILKPLGVAAVGAGSPPCVGEKGICGLDFRLVVQGWSRSLGLCLTVRQRVMRRGLNLLSGNLALVGSDGNTNRDSLAENDLAVLTPEK